MDRLIFLFLAAILAGFALLELSLPAFLAFLAPFITFVGTLAILVFSFVLIFKAFKALFKK
ncbi:hypothetical protein M4D55_05690 [Metabacillus idriensis]|uniref:Uncharacterized protein n=1 Tax=Metabacillus idriensis TaxID=324768 RepID=A0A6I2M5S8_9BACI|nr:MULTISPECIES: hypothetical protein [Bacillaceae]MCM3595279.1 hypothetical protein [Metabacillus idriensis]MRX52694.1 hypothetical protein [Metabacillus idriensis]OHR72429.1 hypothetical protein HMPREF3291_21930 [Bacillus sp. HMSC76G11]TDL80684.1 hypothetical protein E2R53_11815 [Peribacillus frigoritolerans]